MSPPRPTDSKTALPRHRRVIEGICLLLPVLVAAAMRAAVLGRPPFTDDGWYASVARLCGSTTGPLIHSPLTVYPRLFSWLAMGDGVRGLLHLRLVDGAFACIAAAAVARLLSRICGNTRASVIACLWAAAVNTPVFIDAGFKNQIIAATGLLCMGLCCLIPRGMALPKTGWVVMGAALIALSVLMRESFAPLALVAVAVCLVRNGWRPTAWLVVCGGGFGAAGLCVVAGGPGHVVELMQAWRATAAALANFSAIMNRPWRSVFTDSGQQALLGASWVVPLMGMALLGGLMRGVRRPLLTAGRPLGEARSNRRIAVWLGVGLIAALVPEMAMKLVFPYHFSQLLLGAAVLGAVCIDQVSLRRARGQRIVASVACGCVLWGGWLLIGNIRFSMGAWQQSQRWWPVMVDGTSQDALVKDSFYLRLAEAVQGVVRPGDRVLVSGLYFTIFGLTDAQPVSGLAADASFLECLPEGTLRQQAVEQLRASPPRIVVESKRIATRFTELVPGFPDRYELVAELTPGTYGSYSPYDARVWVRRE